MNTISTLSTAGFAKPPIEVSCVLNPPVAMVVKAWQSASYHPRPAIMSATMQDSESAQYTPQSSRAVSLIRGVSRSGDGPGASARKSCIPPTPSRGRMARLSTTMPMPPSHWIIERQSRGPRCSPTVTASPVSGSVTTRCSMSERIDAPVVVNPLTDSKAASVNDGICPDNQKGMAPNSPTTSHPTLTITKPSRLRRSCRPRSNKAVGAPSARPIPMHRANHGAASSPANNDTKNGTSMAIAVAANSSPNTRTTASRFTPTIT